MRAELSRLFFATSVLVLGSALLPAPAVQAQVLPPEKRPDILMEEQRKSEERKKKQDEITQPKAPPQIDKPERKRPPKGTEAKVKVTQIKFTGNTVIRTKDLEAVVAPTIGQTVTLRELAEVAGLVSEHYAAKGFILAQAYLPPQEIRGGVVEIAILEGKVGNVAVSGNKRYKSSTILRQLEPVRKLGIIHEGVLETALTELNDYPGLKVRAALKPGEKRGLTDLELTARERLPYSLALDINNYGSRFTGPWVYSGEIGVGNLAGRGDNLTLKGSKTDDNQFFTNVTYLIPLTSFGTKLQLSCVHTENLIGEEFALLRPTGRADIASVDVLQTITRTGALSVTGVVGFDFKTIRNLVAQDGPSATLISKDELRVFRVGLRGDYRDPLLGRTYFGLTAHRGVDFFGGTQQDAQHTSFNTVSSGALKGAGPGNWSKLTLDLARFQSLGLPFLQGIPVLPSVLNDSYLILRAVGQVASDRLLAPERLAIGGYYTVRGYPIAERIGDNGYAATAEMVVPLPVAAKLPFTGSGRTWKETVQLAAFIDHGGTFVSPVSATGQGGYGYLTGAGGGLRVTLPFGVPSPVDQGLVSLKIDWATAVGRPRPSSRDQGISLNHVYGDGAAGVLYVSAALRF